MSGCDMGMVWFWSTAVGAFVFVAQCLPGARADGDDALGSPAVRDTAAGASAPFPEDQLAPLDAQARLEWLLGLLGDDIRVYRYVTANCVTVPVLRARGVGDDLSSVRRFLSILSDRVKTFPRSETGVSQRWFAYMAVIAWGKRLLPENGIDDGRVEYELLFENVGGLCRHREYYRQIVGDFCMVVCRRPWERRDAPLVNARQVTSKWFDQFVLLPELFDREPSLFRLFPSVIGFSDLQRVWRKTVDGGDGVLTARIRVVDILIRSHGGRLRGGVAFPTGALEMLVAVRQDAGFAKLPSAYQNLTLDGLFKAYAQAGMWELAESLQTERIAAGMGGRAELARMYDLERQAALARGARQSRAPSGGDVHAMGSVGAAGNSELDASANLSERIAALVAKRDALFVSAFLDFRCRDDTEDVAEVMFSIGRHDMATSYLQHFLANTSARDACRLRCINRLVGFYMAMARDAASEVSVGDSREEGEGNGAAPDGVPGGLGRRSRWECLVAAFRVTVSEDTRPYSGSSDVAVRAALQTFSRNRERLAALKGSYGAKDESGRPGE